MTSLFLVVETALSSSAKVLSKTNVFDAVTVFCMMLNRTLTPVLSKILPEAEHNRFNKLA